MCVDELAVERALAVPERRQAVAICGLGRPVSRWTQLRLELEPLWIDAHSSWSEPVPDPPSTFMCRYTAELVALVDPAWHVVLGVVDGHTHAWNETMSGEFLDLTGDQFGYPAVQHMPTRPHSYAWHLWTRASSAPFRRRALRWRARLDGASD